MSEQITLDDILQHHKTDAPPPKPTPQAPSNDADPTPKGGIHAKVDDSWREVFTEINVEGEEGESELGENYKAKHGEPSRKAEMSAKLVSRMLDAGASGAINVIGQQNSKSKYRASPDEMEDMEYLWALYLESKGQDIPPGTMLLLFTFMVYGPKIVEAMADRKRKSKAQTVKEEVNGTTTTAEEVEYLEAEEITDDEVLRDEIKRLERELETINKKAISVGLPPFIHHTPIMGYCKYSWLVLGEKIRIYSGQHLSSKESSAWAVLVRKYKAAGIELPTNVKKRNE